jgi:hypothetical protein
VRIKRLQDKHPKGADIKVDLLYIPQTHSLTVIGHISRWRFRIQPNDAWSAIVQGAVLSKLPQEATVVTSVAERHYGVSAGELYEPIRDAKQDKYKYWDEYTEIYRVSRMSWYIRKVWLFDSCVCVMNVVLMINRVTTSNAAAA